MDIESMTDPHCTALHIFSLQPVHQEMLNVTFEKCTADLC